MEDECLLCGAIVKLTKSALKGDGLRLRQHHAKGSRDWCSNTAPSDGHRLCSCGEVVAVVDADVDSITQAVLSGHHRCKKELVHG